jgi:hypothetical protein
VRDDPSGERRRDTCVVAALIGDRSSAPIDFIEWSKGINGGRGKPSCALEWGEVAGRGKETEGEEGGWVRRPLKRQATSGSGTWRGEIWGPG